ncbi:MAG: hypoxanthine phosphoribosyltransferase [Bernardetiaceae bacterium]|jgi:hypoxanthine phosphoribosyltransferase|nr:hypoxanthine phosphoribosyltransferase [Bernardetiaceae bacterium]
MLIKDKHFRPFLDHHQIAQQVARLGSQLNQDYAGKNPLFVAVLNGAFMFAADLMRHITIPSEITFVKFTSYHNLLSTGTVDQIIGFQTDLRDRHVVLVEDIVDTGITMTEILHEIRTFQPASVEICALLLKAEALQREVAVKYVGFEIENKFVVGYGLDYDGHGRNLPGLVILEEETQF